VSTNEENRLLLTDEPVEFDTRATPKRPAAPAFKNTSPTYSPGIQGWDLWWLELLVARGSRFKFKISGKSPINFRGN
jgi:hypothetical protein